MVSSRQLEFLMYTNIFGSIVYFAGIYFCECKINNFLMLRNIKNSLKLALGEI